MAKRREDVTETSAAGRLMQEDEETQTPVPTAERSNGHQSSLEYKVEVQNPRTHVTASPDKSSRRGARCCVFSVLAVLALAGIAVAAFLFISLNGTPEYTDVATRNGVVRGRYVDSPTGVKVEEYLGIPFAKPPVGDLRYHDPVSIDKFPAEPYEAFDHQNSCIQYLDKSFGDFLGMTMWNAENPLSEDCLYLNVWRPDRRKETKSTPKAVMVWIYGGGFYSGSNALWVYDGKALADFGDVIVASMNYRVGTFGYLSTGDGRIKGNFGMKDQVVALQWIKRNIAAFGGNPNQITIFGESSGASSAGLHMMSSHAHHLFQRAIFQSGSPDSHWSFMSQSQARERSSQFFQNVNCTMEDKDELLRCLRRLDATFILNNEWVDLNFMVFPWAPSVDGDYLKDTPYNILKSGQFPKKDSMLGVNKDEGTFWILFSVPGLSKDHNSLQNRSMYNEAINIIDWDLKASLRDEVRQLYSPSDINDYAGYRDALDKVCGDRSFTCPTIRLAKQLSDSRAKAFFYYLTYRASNEVWPPWMGVIHGAEIQYAFGMPQNKSHGYSEEDVEFAKEIMSYWVNFAKTGDPNGRGLSDWPRYSTDRQAFLEMRGPGDFVVNTTLRPNFCRFWDKVNSQFNQS